MFGMGGPPDVQSGGLSDRRRRKFLNADIIGSNAAVLGLFLGQVLPVFFYGTDIVTAREVFNELWNKYPEISEEYAGRNIKRLFGHGEVDFHLQTKYKPVRTLTDFTGSRICVLLGELSEVFSELGAIESPVTLGKPFYAGIEDGSLTGTLGWVEGLVNMGGVDIVRYSTNLHVPLPPQDYYEVNPVVWDGLPEDIRRVFERNNSYIEAEIDKVSLEIERSAVELAREKGVEFIEFSPQDLSSFGNLLEVRASRKAKELDAKGFPGTAIFKETRQLIAGTKR
jgi:C4-dicarboxylate-binding protein DctP